LDRDEPGFVETTGNHHGNCLSAEIGKLHKFLLSTDVGETTIKLVSAADQAGPRETRLLRRACKFTELVAGIPCLLR
jgi:hypothetical protein